MCGKARVRKTLGRGLSPYGGGVRWYARAGLCLALSLLSLMPVWAQKPVETDPYPSLTAFLKHRAFYQAEQEIRQRIDAGDTALLLRDYAAEVALARHSGMAQAVQNLATLPPTPRRLYLLAKLQSLCYQFEAAIASYETYEAVADKMLLSEIEAQQCVIECRNALQLLQTSYHPVLYHQSRTSWDSVSEHPLLAHLPYRLIPLPAALYGEFDDARVVPPTYVAYPDLLAVGARVIFANRRSKLGQRDLFATTFRHDQLWSPPEEVGRVVNTAFDEALGILSPDGQTLYFSSRGHYGMGGYDIFRSTYDPTLRQWTSPENLGFPYNSPFDDYLFGTPDANGRVVIASTRGGSVDSLQLFMLSYDPAQLGERLAAGDDLEARARFEYPTLASTLTPAVVSERQSAEQQTEKHFRDVDADPEYQEALRLGYAAQQTADSVRKTLEVLRERLWNVKTAEERKLLEKRVAGRENEMLAAQRSADTYFAKASLIEQEYITGVRKLLGHSQSAGAYTQDVPEHLYEAKPAAAVMQPVELKALAEIARQSSLFLREITSLCEQYDNIHRMLNDSTSSTVDIGKAEQAAAQQSQILVKKYGGNVETRRRIFSQCLAVSYMKGERTAKNSIFAAESKAKEYYLLGQTLVNNKDIQDEGEAAFFAMLAAEVGNLYYEVGFSYAWNMEAYRAKVEKRIERYQTLLNLDRVALVPNEPVATKPTPAEVVPGEVRPRPSVTAPTLVLKSDAEGLTIVDPSPYASEGEVPRDLPQPQGVIYRLQLGAYSNPIDPALFQGMYPIIAETLQGGKIRKYYAGAFRLKEEAEKGKQITTRCGFPDAFVVAWYNGRHVTLARAQSVEKEDIPTQEVSQEVVANGYVVVIGCYDSALPSEVAATVSLLAPDKEITSRVTPEGVTQYGVGYYPQRVQAERLRDNLLASGLLEARVVGASEQ